MSRPLRIAAWTVALAAGAPALAAVCDGISDAPSTPLTTVRVASGLTRPLFATAPPDDVDRVFLVEQDGRILILRNGVVEATPFLDIRTIVRSPADSAGNEEGLLGLAFHPQYDVNGWLFVYYTNTSGNNVVARYTRSGSNPDAADSASRVEVLPLAHPSNTNHNGGMIAFGPDDGYLYIAPGDGGAFCDLSENSQNGSSLLGKMLRIDVDALPYTIPADNPFVGAGAPLDEIWSQGLRNPFRFSFDRENGDLYIGDVGQDLWEEIDYLAAPNAGRGANFGWDNYEGTRCPNPSCANEGPCTLANLVLPVVEYPHSEGCSVAGGYVYRGCRMRDLRGTYFYGDYCGDFVRSFRIVGGTATDRRDRTAELAPGGGLTIADITSFGEDARGEIYIFDRGSGATGEVYKIVPILPNLEVSGSGATPFVLVKGGPWTWEDLQATSSHPIATYRVWRHSGRGNGVFDCVFASADNVWPGGDVQTPAPGSLFSYVVTGENAAGGRTSPGTATDGAPRALSSGPCP